MKEGGNKNPLLPGKEIWKLRRKKKEEKDAVRAAAVKLHHRSLYGVHEIETAQPHPKTTHNNVHER